MSNFYMSHTSDSRKQVTRCGHNYMETHLAGWNSGIEVVCSRDEKGNDEFRVYKTGGSNNPSSRRLVYEHKEL